MRALYGLGYTYLRHGSHEAADRFQQALETARDIGDRYGEIYALHGLGQVHLRQGRHEKATHCLDQALRIARDSGTRNHQFQVHHAFGRPEPARRHWQAAMDILVAHDSDHTEDPQVNTAALHAHLTKTNTGKRPAKP